MHCNNLRLVLELGLVRVSLFEAPALSDCCFRRCVQINLLTYLLAVGLGLGLGLSLGLVLWLRLALEQAGW